MFTEVEGVTEVIFCLIICLVGLLNVAIGIVNETVSTRQPVIEVQKVPMTSSQQSVAQNYQIDGEESHIVSTAKHHANRGTSPI
jgi:cell division protein FtsL